jgi:lariat debranching enzyme
MIVRNAADLTIMSCPVKYRELGDFWKYYSGTAKAPYTTIFIGGNHEASSHLWELYYGGWVAPNIYYLGAANVLRMGPIRIAGLSGIWKGFDYNKPHHERLPFNQDDVKSCYHIREFDVRKLLLVRTQVDVGLSHDWPRAIEKHGDSETLFKKKRDFRQESLDGTLGNVAAKYVMDRLRPPYWFSAHLHVKFAAVRRYQEEKENSASEEGRVHQNKLSASAPDQPPTAVRESNPDEIDLDMDENENEGVEKPDADVNVEAQTINEGSQEANTVSEELRAQLPAAFARPAQQTNQQRLKTTPGQPVPNTIPNKEVRFLALDKCLPGRHFLQLCEIHPYDTDSYVKNLPSSGSPRYRLQYDPEWLAITRVFHKYLQVGDAAVTLPPDLGEQSYIPMIDAERQWVDEHVVAPNKLDVPYNFELTAPTHVPGTPEIIEDQPEEYTNPQTVAFCALLELENIWDAPAHERDERRARGPAMSERGGSHPRRGGSRGGSRGRGGRGRGGIRGRGYRGRW